MINNSLLTEKHELRDLYSIGDENSLLIDDEFQYELSNECIKLSSDKDEMQPLIDFVLVYEERSHDSDDTISSFEHAQKAMRKNFEANLQHYGLILNYRKVPLKNQQQRVYVLITIPFEKLLEMCEITREYKLIFKNR